MWEDQINGPYTTDLEPALASGAFVEILPQGEVREVTAVEVIPKVVTQEISVPAGETESEIEMRQLYASDGVLAQLRLPSPAGGENAIPEGVQITVDQGGEESPRFNLKNSRGFYDQDVVSYGTGSPQTELYVWENTDLFFTVENTSGGDVTFTLAYTGWAYKTERSPDSAPDISVLTERFSLRG